MPRRTGTRCARSCTATRPSTPATAGSSSPCRPPRSPCIPPTVPRQHELYLICDDIAATTAELVERGVVVDAEVSDRGWGLVTSIRLPGGGALGLYQPRHPLAAAVTPR